jgi:hypothetical protein
VSGTPRASWRPFRSKISGFRAAICTSVSITSTTAMTVTSERRLLEVRQSCSAE